MYYCSCNLQFQFLKNFTSKIVKNCLIKERKSKKVKAPMFSSIRKFGTSVTSYKDLSKFIQNCESKIPELKSAPTIYNHKSSASNYKGYMKAKIPAGIYYQPAQSSSTGSINSETIPQSFLPKDDPRRAFFSLSSADSQASLLAPPLQVRKEKSYHLTPKDVEEIIKLRKENPNKYTRKVLSKKFGVSPLFISLVSNASEERKREMNRRLEIIKDNWHPKRVVAREDRKKRKELWYRA